MLVGVSAYSSYSCERIWIDSVVLDNSSCVTCSRVAGRLGNCKEYLNRAVQ